MTTGRLVWLGLVLGWAGIASAATTEKPRLKLEPFASQPTWQAQQFLRADQKGNLFVLRADTLEVFPISRSGELGEPQKLNRLGDAARPETAVVSAAVSADGERWLLQVFVDARPVLLFEKGKEKALPSPEWRVESVGFVGNEPLVAVSAIKMGGETEATEGWKPPLLRHLVRAQWKDFLLEEVSIQHPREIFEAGLHARAVLVALGPESSIWVIRRYSYRLRRFSAAGKQLEEVLIPRQQARVSPTQRGRGQGHGGEGRRGGWQRWPVAA